MKHSVFKFTNDPVIGNKYSTNLGFGKVTKPAEENKKTDSEPLISQSLNSKPQIILPQKPSNTLAAQFLGMKPLLNPSVILPNAIQTVTSINGANIVNSFLNFIGTQTVNFNNANVINFKLENITAKDLTLIDASNNKLCEIVAKKVTANSSGVICQITMPNVRWCVYIQFFGDQTKFIKGDATVSSDGTVFYGVINRTNVTPFGVPSFSIVGNTITMAASPSNSGSTWIIVAQGAFFATTSASIVIS